MASAVTTLGKLGIGTADPVTTLLNHSQFELGINLMLRDTNATRGTFNKDGTGRVRHSRTMITPHIHCEPSQAELLVLIPWVMGQAATGTTTKTMSLSNTAYEHYVHWKPVAGEEVMLTGTVVDVGTFAASSGEPISVDLGLVARTYDDTRSDFPSLTPDQTSQPFLLTDLSLSFDGSTVQCREFSVSVNNGIDRSRFLNSLTLTRTQKLQRSITVTLDVPAGDNTGLWNEGIEGAAMVATFTNSAQSKILTFTLPDIRFPGQSPTYPLGQEGFLRIQGEAYRTSGNAEPLTISLTS